MSQPVGETTTTATFVLRFWREWSDAEPRWRGRIEHVQSGQGAGFLDIEGLLEFLERFGIGGAAFRETMTGGPEDDA
jgi:hypothetical protein